MIGLLLDIIAVNVIVAILQRGDELDFAHNALVAIGIGAINFFCSFFLAEHLGLGVFLLIFVLDGIIFLRFCYLTLSQTAIALAIFTAYKVGYLILLEQMFP